MILGNTIREIRKRRKLTLQDVARLTGLSVGFLSQIEHSQSTPSLSSLRKIADALNSSLFTLLASEEGAATVVRRANRCRVQMEDSNITYELLSPRQPGLKMGLSSVLLEPGMSTADEPRSHQEGEEFALVFHGSVNVELGIEKFTLEEGDGIYFNSCIPHRYVNKGLSSAILLLASAPPQM